MVKIYLLGDHDEVMRRRRAEPPQGTSVEAWMDVFEPDAFFFLRRIGTDVNHLWRLFRSREDARWFVEKHLGGDPHARTWPDLLPAEDFEDFLKRYRAS